MSITCPNKITAIGRPDRAVTDVPAQVFKRLAARSRQARQPGAASVTPPQRVAESD